MAKNWWVLPSIPFWPTTRLAGNPACGTEYQRQGVGRPLYEEFQKLSRDVESMAMYTGLEYPQLFAGTGIRSGHCRRYREFQLDLAGVDADAGSFKPVGEDEAVELLMAWG